MGRIPAMRTAFGILSSIALVCLLVPVFAIREKDSVTAAPVEGSAFSSLVKTFRNKDFRIFVGSDVLYWIALTMFQTTLPMAIFGILPQAMVADISQSDSIATGENREGMFYAARTFAFKMGQSASLLIFTGIV